MILMTTKECPDCKIEIPKINIRCFPCHYKYLKSEENRKTKTADRFNDGKVQLSYIPNKAQEAEARVWMKGAKKYSRDNWKKGLPFLSVIDSMLRHVLAFKEGEDNDPETGESHMAHVKCNASMLIEFLSTHPELDDRKPK